MPKPSTWRKTLEASMRPAEADVEKVEHTLQIGAGQGGGRRMKTATRDRWWAEALRGRGTDVNVNAKWDVNVSTLST